jgi:hypothetical protein
MKVKARLIVAAPVAAIVLCAAAPVQAAPADDNQRRQSAAPRLNNQGDLSQKLDKKDGVIRPEGNVDDAMEKKTPKLDDKLVVPPPGGDPDVQPK